MRNKQLNKKKCKQALKNMTFEVLRNDNNVIFSESVNKRVLKSRFQRNHDMLDSLINQHFDNQFSDEELEYISLAINGLSEHFVGDNQKAYQNIEEKIRNQRENLMEEF